MWLFSPDEFVEQIHELRLIGASSWYVDRVRPTTENTLEFMVRLRRLPVDSDVARAPADELAGRTDRPEWNLDPAGARREAALEVEVDRLRLHAANLEDINAAQATRLERRRGRADRLRKRLHHKSQVIETQRRRIEAQRNQLARQRDRLTAPPPSLAKRVLRRVRRTTRRTPPPPT